MKLKTGLLEPEPGWKLILDQYGVWWHAGINWQADLNKEYSVLIINKPLPDVHGLKKIERYLQNGGAVIDLGYVLHLIRGTEIGRTFKKTFFPTPTPFYTPNEPVDIYRNIWLYPEAEYCEGAICWHKMGEGAGAFIGWEINPLMTDERASFKEFPHTDGNRPFEYVSLVSKSEISRFIFGLLKWLHVVRGIPFVHKWYIPGLSEQLFLFRVDAGFGSRRELQHLADLTTENHIPTSWFLQVQTQEKWLGDFPKGEMDEIATQGYTDKASYRYKFNCGNIQKALDILNEYHIYPKGLAVPDGLWNPAIARAVGNFKFQYSSEHVLGYNYLPYFVESYKSEPSLLQIPVHPVSIGSFRKTDADSADTERYFMGVIERNEAHHEPVALYYRSKDGNLDILEKIFMEVKKRSFLFNTFIDYAAWWRKRHEFTFRAIWDGSQPELKTDFDSTVALAVHNSIKQCNLCRKGAEGGYLQKETSLFFKSLPPFSKKNLKQTRGFNHRFLKQALLNFMKYF